jgi:ABC-type cobalamin/Fe3+-siderophores transport system ATPase subunit
VSAPLLEARGVHAGYGRTPVLRGVDLALHAGEVVGVIGPNGAGKSTLVAVLTRLLQPTAGAVTLVGRALRSLSRREIARALAVVPQGAPRPEGFRAREVVEMGRTPHLHPWSSFAAADHRAVAAALAQTGCEPLADRRVEELSGGEWQRVLLARAFAQEPRVLLLDEPTTHLDLRYQQGVARAVRSAAQAGLAVLWVIHDLETAAHRCQRLALLAEGVIVAEGTPRDVLTRPLLERVYRADLTVEPGPAPIVRLLP